MLYFLEMVYCRAFCLILKYFGQNKMHMRECVLNTLDSRIVDVHLYNMVCSDFKCCILYSVILLSLLFSKA